MHALHPRSTTKKLSQSSKKPSYDTASTRRQRQMLYEHHLASIPIVASRNALPRIQRAHIPGYEPRSRLLRTFLAFIRVQSPYKASNHCLVESSCHQAICVAGLDPEFGRAGTTRMPWSTLSNLDGDHGPLVYIANVETSITWCKVWIFAESSNKASASYSELLVTYIFRRQHHILGFTSTKLKMRYTTTALLAALVSTVTAQAGDWQQCTTSTLG
jgi:hypothetical protein